MACVYTKKDKPSKRKRGSQPEAEVDTEIMAPQQISPRVLKPTGEIHTHPTITESGVGPAAQAHIQS